ncbi:hydantoinase B/oxoprolinase family protein [Nannocystis pusilla]|uniref:hydantoinase B/oxoprolinase family protein n=1 Tax=Nannocystis pusilla TaxID=889268 RepID=UPI003B82FE28
MRELEFLRGGIEVSIVAERRSRAPFGLAGGAAGACGRSCWTARSCLDARESRCRPASASRSRRPAAEATASRAPGPAR